MSPRCPNFVKALIQYIKEGGALFSTHDQFDDAHSRWITQEALAMQKLIGLTLVNSHGNGGSVAFFDKTAINNTFFAINHILYGDVIPIANTHQTYSRFDESCTTCKVMMKFKEMVIIFLNILLLIDHIKEKLSILELDIELILVWK